MHVEIIVFSRKNQKCYDFILETVQYFVFQFLLIQTLSVILIKILLLKYTTVIIPTRVASARSVAKQ